MNTLLTFLRDEFLADVLGHPNRIQIHVNRFRFEADIIRRHGVGYRFFKVLNAFWRIQDRAYVENQVLIR